MDRVVVVKDEWKNQQQMHQDTYFNIILPDLAVLVAERMGMGDAKAVAERRLTADVYEMDRGAYRKVLDSVDFVSYMTETLGFRLVPVSNEDQLNYGINFLTIRSNRILGIDGVSDAYKETLRDLGVDATWMDFGNLTGGYGAAHYSTQVLRREAR